jgi:hypothetical protein
MVSGAAAGGALLVALAVGAVMWALKQTGVRPKVKTVKDDLTSDITEPSVPSSAGAEIEMSAISIQVQPLPAEVTEGKVADADPNPVAEIAKIDPAENAQVDPATSPPI